MSATPTPAVDAREAATPADAAPAMVAALGRFAHRLDLEAVPAGVRSQAKLCILDTMGCVASGSDEEDAMAALRVERETSLLGEASVVCSDIKLSAEAATRVNAFMGDIFELNDFIGGHASIGNVTAAVALAEAVGASGKELLEAVIAGIEVTARVYSGFYAKMKPYTEVGMVPIGIPASFGAAAAAARLLKLDERGTIQALAIAGALAGWNPAEVFFGEGGSIKPMVLGAQPGSTGILAARYARAGLSGPPGILESKVGYFATVSRGVDRDAVLGHRWYLAEPRRKLHSCCAYIHSMVESMGSLRRAGGAIADAAEIRISVPAYLIPAVSKERAPQNATETRFNARYCAALAAVEADTIRIEHSRDFRAYLARPDITDTMARIRIVPDPALTHFFQSRVTLLDRRGTATGRAECQAPKGAPANPMSDADVTDKFRDLASPHMGQSALEEYIARIAALEHARSSEWVATAFNPGPHHSARFRADTHRAPDR